MSKVEWHAEVLNPGKEYPFFSVWTWESDSAATATLQVVRENWEKMHWEKPNVNIAIQRHGRPERFLFTVTVHGPPMLSVRETL